MLWIFPSCVVGVRPWLLAGVIATVGVAHGDSFPPYPSPPPVPRPGPSAARGWIRGTVTWLEQATLECRSLGAAVEGCVVGAQDPWCKHGPQNVTVTIDGAPQSVTRPANGVWEVCGLSPGRHVLTMCSSRGDFRCNAEASTVVQLVEVEPRVHVRVDHVFVGPPSWAGQTLSFTLGNAQTATDLELPPQITLAWTEEGNLPHAYLCQPPRSRSPGCARCGAAGDPEQAGFLLAVVATFTGRRR